MDEIDDNVLAFGAPQGINSMFEIGNKMAGFGRNGDDQLVHMKTGEIAVSPDLLEENPKLAEELTNAFQRSNVDMDRYVAGSPSNSINPMTGQREFFLKKLVKGIKKVFKAVAPIIIPMAINFFAPGLGTVASGALGAGIGTLVQGGSFKDAMKSAAIGGFVGGVSAAAKIGGPAGANTPWERAFGRLGGMDTPIIRPGYFGTPSESILQKETLVNNAGATDPVVKPGATDPVVKPGATDPVDPVVNEPGALKTFYNEQISPSRGMPTNSQIAAEAASIEKTFAAKGVELAPGKALEMAKEALTPSVLSQYAPMAAIGTAAMGAFGGFETPEQDLSSPYGYTSREELERNPTKYSVMSGINFRRPYAGPTRAADEKYIFQNYLPEITQAASGGEMSFPRKNGYISGPGTEVSDDIPAMLSDGEFVMTAKAVRGLGNGSRKQGVRKMYDMMRAFEGGVVA
jgi:hypothetical protein